MISFKSKYFVAGLEYGLPVLVILLVSLLIWIIFFSSFFQLTKLECYQDFEPCQNQNVLAEIDKLRGQNIFLFQPATVLRHLTSGDYLIRNGQLERILPGSLILHLQSVYPVLALRVLGNERFATLDSQLRVIRFTTSDPNVPIVQFDTPLTLTLSQPIADQNITQILQKSLIIAQAMPGIKIITVKGDDLTLTLTPAPQAILTTHRDIDSQINALRSVLSDATITEGVAIIDVRFGQPILRNN